MDEQPGPVPVADAEIAAGIARAAASGRAADRRPTPEQLVAAFGEPAATDVARRRAAAALALAGVRVEPDLRHAPAGERVTLHVAAAAGGGRAAGTRPRRVLLGLAAVGAVLVAGVAAASLLGDGDGESVGEALPAGTSTSVTAAPAPPTTPPATTATLAAPATTATTDTAAEEEADAEEEAERRRRARARARARREREQAAARRRRRTVTVRVDASARPTFLCVEDGEGRELFNGTLSGRRVFRARVVALNVGLATTVIKYGRRTVNLPGSPAGVLITRNGHTPLELGDRPCA